MNFKTARELLELKNNFSLQDLKKNYHMKALKTHPDKCINDPEANEKFKKINDAYQYMLDYLSVTGEINKKDIEKDQSYHNLLSRFLNIDHNTLRELISKITQGYHNITVSMFENMEKDDSVELYNFIIKYKDLLYVSDKDIEKIKKIIIEKVKNENIYILNPSIEDLFNHRIFKLKCDDDIFYVPLWHSELQFTHLHENEMSDINVMCVPELPDNIKIDQYNNIHYNVTISLKGILTKEVIDIFLCNLEDGERKNITINVSELRITKFQSIILRKQGIAVINTEDSYNIDKLSDIIVHITLTES